MKNIMFLIQARAWFQFEEVCLYSFFKDWTQVV